jgi:uncharacterized integral membrane protein
MIIFFILGLVLGIGLVFFALQNVAIITVSFFSWHLTGSLALILSVAILAGALVVTLFILPETVKNAWNFRKLKKENASLAEDLRKQKELAAFSKKTSPTDGEIARIQDGETPRI